MAERGSGIRPELLVVVGGAVLAGITMYWNLFASPDSQYDEVVYTRAAQQVAQGWQLTWTNSPMFVHPPISFLIQGLWLRVLGKGDAPLADAILYARLLTAGMTVLAVLLIGLLAAYLLAAAGRRRSLVLVGLVVLFAATDPVLLRYGRLALIEPIALVVAILALCLAIRLRNERALVYIPLVGLATGLALLTKEVTAFILFTPVVHALIGRDWRRVAVTAGGFGWGLGLWLLFPLWAVALGLTGDFIDVKFATVQRLLGLIQITGWNRPGVSFAGAIAAQLGQYASSYLFLAGGALALVWLLTRQVTGASRWLLAWLITSYAFAAYMVLLGTLNEQFFVYILPASIVGTVLAGDAVVAWAGRRSPRRAGAVLGVVGLLAVGVAGLAGMTWVRNYTANNAALFAVTERIGELPVCAAVSVTGDPDKFSYLLNGQEIATFATAEGALAHGVHLFVLSDKDVASGYGSATRELLTGVRGQGALVAEYPSFTYGGLQLWRVPVDPYAPLADSEALPGGGTFVITDENRCGGYPVTDGAVADGAGGGFASGWAALGGKPVVGAPMTAAWVDGPGAAVQVFTGAVLRSEGGGPAVAAQIVPALAAGRGYAAAGMPPVTFGAGGSDSQVLARLTDPAIGAGYLGLPPGAPLQLGQVAAARARLGDPVGPPTRMPDGMVRQAFEGGVLEHGGAVTGVRLAPIGRLALEAGQLGGATAVPPRPSAAGSAVSGLDVTSSPAVVAAIPLAAPPLAVAVEPGLPTTVQPFITALLAGLALYTALPVVALELARGGRRPRRSGPPADRRPPPAGPPPGPGGYPPYGVGGPGPPGGPAWPNSPGGPGRPSSTGAPGGPGWPSSTGAPGGPGWPGDPGGPGRASGTGTR